MRKYYTRPCNFYYGNYARKLISKKKALPLCGNNLIAFDGGYKRARTAVLDANITTLIAAAILFFFGSGPVKGFAITLGIGIISTLFSVFYFARHITSFYVSKNKDTC